MSDSRQRYADIVRRATETVPASMSEEEAFYTILAASVVADQEELAVETEEREALVHRSKTLQKMREERPAELNSLKQRIHEKLQDFSRLNSLVVDAARTFRDSPEKAYAVFAHAADIVFADSRFVEKEREFLITLASGLEIDPRHMEEILVFIGKKNSF